MTNFFKNDTPERLAKLEGQIETLKAEFKLALAEQARQFDHDLEEMETALLNRIEQAEKSSRSDSLKADGKKPEEGEQIGGGYKTWTQRKANRVIAGADPGFAQKVLRRAQRSMSSNSSAPSTSPTR